MGQFLTPFLEKYHFFRPIFRDFNEFYYFFVIFVNFACFDHFREFECLRACVKTEKFSKNTDFSEKDGFWTHAMHELCPAQW